MDGHQILTLIRDEKQAVLDELNKRRPWHANAVRIIGILAAMENARYFLESPVKSHPEYLTLIGNHSPMWINKVRSKLEAFDYNEVVGFLKDVRLIFENCYRFHTSCGVLNLESAIVKSAAVLEIEFELQAVLLKLDAPVNPDDVKNLWLKASAKLRAMAGQSIMKRYGEEPSSIKKEATRKRLLSFLRENEHRTKNVQSARSTRLPAASIRHVPAVPNDDESVAFNEAPVQLPQNEHRYTVEFIPMHSSVAVAEGDES